MGCEVLSGGSGGAGRAAGVALCGEERSGRGAGERGPAGGCGRAGRRASAMIHEQWPALGEYVGSSGEMLGHTTAGAEGGAGGGACGECLSMS